MDRLLYYFECPVCGFDHHEAKRLAEEDEIYCPLCAGDNGRDVRLKRTLARLEKEIANG
jgi:rubredoxin